MTMSLACTKEKDGGENAAASSVGTPIVQTAATSGSAATPTPAGSPGKHAEHARGHREGGGVGMMLGEARNLDLKDTQKATIDKLTQQLHGDEDSSKDELKDVHASLVADVRSGKIDAVKLAPLYASMDKAMQARKEKEAEVLNGLHASLEPAQRKVLVSNVRAKQAERETHGAQRKGNLHKPGDADWNNRRLERMTKELHLDAAQQKSVGALLAKEDHSKSAAAMDTMRSEMKKRTDAVLTAFEGDKFDAKKLDLSPMPGKKLSGPMDRHIQFLSQLLPILKPEQREKLATKMSKPHGPVPGIQGDRDNEFGACPFCDDSHGEDRALDDSPTPKTPSVP